MLPFPIKKNGKWKFFCFEATTDPGDNWMDNPMVREKGTAILKPGQYRGSHIKLDYMVENIPH